jgi:hypothetical protein
MKLFTNRKWQEQHAEGRHFAERKVPGGFLTGLLALNVKAASKYRAITSCKVGLKAEQDKTTDHGNF